MIALLIRSAENPFFRATALILTLFMMWVLSRQGEMLQTKEAPNRVVSLELAWTGKNAQKVITSWDAKQVRPVAIKQVLLDFIFIAAYACLLFYIGLTAGKAARALDLILIARIAHLAAWGGLLAGLFDCLENFGLLIMLWGRPTNLVAAVTSVFAVLKFALAGAVFGAALVVFVVS